MNSKRNYLGANRFLPYIMVTPVQVMLFLVLLVPAIYAAYLSFHDYSFGLPKLFVGWSNYVYLWQDASFWRALLNNVIFVNISVYGELILALGIAVLFAGGFRFQRLWVSITLAPYAVSTVVAVIMWKYLLEPDIGLINYLLSSLGFNEILWMVNRFQAFATIILLEVWLFVPFSFLILYAALMAVPQELHEAAHVDGASGFQAFRYVTFPVILPAILTALMFRYIFAFRAFDVVWIMTGGGPVRATELLSVYLYRHGFRYFDFGVASAVAWIMLIVTIMIASYYLYIIYRRMFSHES